MARVRKFRVRLSWIVAAILLAAFWSVLLVDGLVHPPIGSDGTGAVERADESTGGVPDEVRDGGPAIEASDAGAQSRAMPPKTIALTFDDGPDPAWTPQILRVLDKYDVPGTFFVVGSSVAQHPDVVRAMRASGSEVGLHTFDHVDLATVDDATVEDELSRNQIALAGAIGETSYLTRPPYSSGPSSLTHRQLETVRFVTSRGQLTVLSDVDSRDWTRSGVNEIVRSSRPAEGKGAIVLMHDGGGERSLTVEALDELVPQLIAEGYRFTTVTEGLGLPAANTPASADLVREGRFLISAVAISSVLLTVLTWLLLLGAVLVALRLAVVGVLAARHYRQRRPGYWAWGPRVVREVSVIVPAYNERECIESTVRSLVSSTHPIEVIVVDDGSTDGTADIVEAMGLPGVRVLRQANGGKPAALNNGIAHARNDIIVMMDGDTVFEPSTIHELVQPFADPSVGAVAGNAKVSNRSKLVTRLQHIEYVIGFNLDRRAYDLLGCMPTVPGAVGAFRRSALRQVGGLSADTLAEDTDLTMAICGAGFRVVYQESARAWTEAPETLAQLWRQRYRWSYGTMQSMWKHRRSGFGQGSGGRLGRFALWHLALFQVVLPLLAPLIDVFLVYGVLFVDPLRTLAAWSAVLAVQLALAAYAFRLERESLRPLLLMPLQQIVYRQLMYAVLIKSVATAVGGVRLRWQKMHRIGAANASLAASMGDGGSVAVPGARPAPLGPAGHPPSVGGPAVLPQVSRTPAGVPRGPAGPAGPTQAGSGRIPAQRWVAPTSAALPVPRPPQDRGAQQPRDRGPVTQRPGARRSGHRLG